MTFVNTLFPNKSSFVVIGHEHLSTSLEGHISVDYLWRDLYGGDIACTADDANGYTLLHH